MASDRAGDGKRVRNPAYPSRSSGITRPGYSYHCQLREKVGTAEGRTVIGQVGVRRMRGDEDDSGQQPSYDEHQAEGTPHLSLGKRQREHDDSRVTGH